MHVELSTQDACNMQKLKLEDSEGTERGMVSMRGEARNTEISCHPGWWQSHLCCSSVLDP